MPTEGQGVEFGNNVAPVAAFGGFIEAVLPQSGMEVLIGQSFYDVREACNDTMHVFEVLQSYSQWYLYEQVAMVGLEFGSMVVTARPMLLRTNGAEFACLAPNAAIAECHNTAPPVGPRSRSSELIARDANMISGYGGGRAKAVRDIRWS